MQIVRRATLLASLAWLAGACAKEQPASPGSSGHPEFSFGGRATTNCAGCHSDATGAVLTITGPQSVSPGATNQYTARITGGPAVAGGVDIRVPAGTLGSITGQGTKLLTSGAFIDIVHSAPKAFSAGAVTWNFNWTAPTTTGTVNMTGAGVSANSDGSEAGDAGDGSTTFPITVAAANQPPVANAGPDQTVNDADGNGSQAVTLNGSASTDDGSIASYAWREGTTALATGATPAVTLAVGTHTITLTVTDNGNPALTATDVVVITVTPQVTTNQPPVANAGPDQTVNDADGNGTQAVTLNGSASTDDGSIASYAWREGTTALATGATPAVTLAVGTHTITLTVTDNGNPALTATDVVVITVTPQVTTNQPPVANAGPDQTVNDADGNGSQAVTLNGSASTDDGSIASYAWREGTTALATGATPAVTLAVGTHTITLTVTDNGNPALTATDVVVITVTPQVTTNQPPVANAGPDQTVNDADGNGSQAVTLNGSASTDDGSIASYAWREGTTALATGASPAVTLAVGTHTITLTVTDNGNPALTATDVVVITVTPRVTTNQPPVAKAGGPYRGTEGVPVRFNGTRSYAPAGSIVSYQWTFGDGSVGTGPTPSHTYACSGEFKVGLVVTDNLGVSARDNTKVEVRHRGHGGDGEREREAERNRCQGSGHDGDDGHDGHDGHHE